MRILMLLMCYYTLILTQEAKAKKFECPPLSDEMHAKLMELVVKEDVDDVDEEINGNGVELWGPSFFFRQQFVCVNQTRQFFNETALEQTWQAWEEKTGLYHKKTSFFVRGKEKNTFLDIIPKDKDEEEYVLGKVYVLYAKKGVFGYFWCSTMQLPPNVTSKPFPWVAAVSAPLHVNGIPELQDAVDEARKIITDNKDILGDTTWYKNACSNVLR